MPATKAAVFSSNVLLGDGVGTTGAPGSYFGFGQTGTSPASTGPRLQSGSGNPNGVVSSPLGSQWTDSATGILYLNTDGATAWSVIGSSGAMWSPLVEQNPANPITDYFPGSTLNAKWTEFDNDANTTVSVSATRRLQLLQTTHAGNSVAGIFQPVGAATRYAITTKIGISGIVNNIMNGGIFVAGDIVGAPTTAPILTLDMIFNSAVSGGVPTIEFLNWTDYNSLAGSLSSKLLGQGINVLRIFVDTVGANFFLLTSADGETWAKFAVVAFAATTIGAAPLYMGQHVNNGNTGEDVSLFSSMFRVDATTDPYLPCGAFA